MRFRSLFLMGALGGLALAAGCATQVPHSDPVYHKVDSVQKRLDHLQHVVEGQGLMNVASNQQQLQQQVAQLQGQIQELQHELQQAQTGQQSVDKAFDQRLAALEQGASAVGIQAGAKGRGKQRAAQKSSAAASSGAGAQATPLDYRAYRAAFNKLRNGDDAAAISSFQKFVKDYPNSRFVPNAWYWMGEAHYVDGAYKQAIASFQNVLSKYASSPKASDSYLKIGYAQVALKDYEAARQTFHSVIQRYPGTTASDLARQRLQQMKAQGQ